MLNDAGVELGINYELPVILPQESQTVRPLSALHTLFWLLPSMSIKARCMEKHLDASLRAPVPRRVVST